MMKRVPVISGKTIVNFSRESFPFTMISSNLTVRMKIMYYIYKYVCLLLMMPSKLQLNLLQKMDSNSLNQ